MEDEDYEIERTLCQLPQVHVFKIPVRMTAEGHRAADWPKESVWTGRLKITAKGKIPTVTLFDDVNPSFAVCIVNDDSAIERCLDSGRYFVLRITNNAGRHAFIGIAFNERNDAFDFNVALQEHKKEVERESGLIQHDVDRVIAPLKDLSLKEGEKIKINITTNRPKTKKETSGGSVGLLAPPPGPGLVKPREVKAAEPIVSTPPIAASNDSIWGDFGSSTQAVPDKPNSAADPWGDFGGFGEAPKSSSSASVQKSGGDNTVNLLDFDF